ncbi:LysM peptidoglycan-binding domain-containing protein [Leucobacter sp. UT-8R-CII-1-4]|uniref:LysM peptidoglycan-binding domain-containing protein n=1 Tax=Leucobacter sp. UT-8R-CII-1-4 TaxID=3040075 RepID=UPI0024A97046|nr:LysM peptidoglycan-binding domain-containing protein [Leucobacter sp. UT-8R-CII-1-4]MDI6022933.1 LysM peptidoglycan-binding domain-containing protein [Leucobacter sp. UT-8R-CII-1-4]
MTASIATISSPMTSPIARAVAAVDAAAQAAPLASQAARTRLRLTRRGRAVFGALATLLVIGALAIAAVFGGSQAVATAESGNTDFGYVVVLPGESLWSVASALDPNVDPRDLVAEIVQLNKLDGSGVQAGQPIAVPLRYAEAPGVASASELGI